MYTLIKIYCPKDTQKRCYIYYREGAKKIKVYNGKSLGIHCFPNQSNDYKERYCKLQYLASLLSDNLKKGDQPVKSLYKAISISTALEFAESIASKSAYSPMYRRDISSLLKAFKGYLLRQGYANVDFDSLPVFVFQEFLNNYQSSGTYYMNKRRLLISILSKLLKSGLIKSNPAIDTTKRRSLATLNRAYSNTQLLTITEFIQKKSPNLYLCILLMYSSLLRPHQEIRNLKRGDFSVDFRYVFLSGSKNKSGRVRKIPTTDLIRQCLYRMNISELAPDDNIFTRSLNPPNPYYFSLIWSRIKKKLIALDLVTKEQTLYSFRHSAAIAIYSKEKDVALLRELLGHSSITVSLTYLRSLEWGEALVENSLPQLGEDQI